MATVQIDPKLLRTIRTTQRLLGEHICKPPLLEKYLAKPPFRFLHDIFCNVIANTNFLRDVFTANELKYDNVSSPDDKRVFLKKAIDAIEASSGETCDARPSKILAGKEPEKTNELLHLLVKAIINSEDSKQAKSKKGSDSNDNKRKEVHSEKLAEAKLKAKEDPELKKIIKNKPAAPRTAVMKPKTSQVISKEKDVKRADPKKVDRQGTVVVKPNKALVSSSSTSVKKIPSKEAIKPKQEVNKTTTSSTNLAKKSSSNLEKAGSKTALARKPSSNKLSSSKTDIRKEVSIEKLNSSVPASRTNSEIGAKGDISKSVDDAMPPVTMEEIPLQRPVTRTKYRQGNTGEGTTSKSSSKERLISKNPSMEEITQDLLEEESRGSSTSDEVITEHMNEKISQWRATSAEDSDKGSTFKRGWIPEAEQENGSPSGRENVSSVFESEENCSVERKSSSVKFSPSAEKVDDEDGFPSKTLNKSKQVLKRPITVIMDNEDDDDQDQSYLVQERKESLDDIMKQSMGLVNAASEVGLLSQDNRSLLVTQILETQRELENFNHSGISDMQRELAERDQKVLREIYLKQIEDLKEAIQKITKCANPLANITQRSQDDACLMEIEFRKFKQENDRLDRRLDEAKVETSKLLYPCTEELTNLDKCIEKMEAAIALAKQRLHVMDEEFNEDFIEQIAQTPTADEIIEADQYEEGISSNPLWGGIPHAHVIRDDEEHELKMRSTSLQKVFQLAVNMHEGSAEHYDGFSRSQMQRSNLVRLSKSKQRQSHLGGIKTDGRGSGVGGFYGGGGYGGSGAAPISVPPPQVRRHADHYRQQLFGYGGGDSGMLQQYQQREPQLESEIRPTWWD